MADKAGVMIVNGSAMVRQLIARALSGAPEIEIIATAADPLLALAKMHTKWPDVLIIDSEMPSMNGASFVRKVMAKRPTPVIVCVPRAEAPTPAGDEALAAGAVALIKRPRSPLTGPVDGAAADILRAVRRALKSGARIPGARAIAPKLSADAMLRADFPSRHTAHNEQLVAIGTSTGGTQALETVLTHLPASSLGLVIVQHMPAMFTAMFAERLHAVSQIDVREAKNGDRVRPGLALVAPGGKHMMLKSVGAQYLVEVVDGPLINRHRPSVDVLFRSVAKFAGANALGIIMTGMGDDGARGLQEMHDAGARTIAQDEASCVVFGMPNEAIKLGAVDLTLPLAEIASVIVNFKKGSP